MLAVVVACFAAGVVARRALDPPAAVADGLNRFVLLVALPALVLSALPDLELGVDAAVPVAVAWSAVGVASVVILLAARRERWGDRTTGALLLVTALGNTSFLGIALVTALLGDDAVGPALTYDQLGSFLALSTFGAVVASRYGAGEASWRAVVGRLLRFAPFLAVLASIPLRVVPLPDEADRALELLGRLVAPAALLALGLRFRLGGSSRAYRAVAWCLGTRLALLPLLALAAAVVVGGRGTLGWEVAVLQAAMPPMVTAGVVAVEAGLDEEVATLAVGTGTVVALVSVPLWSLLV